MILNLIKPFELSKLGYYISILNCNPLVSETINNNVIFCFLSNNAFVIKMSGYRCQKDLNIVIKKYNLQIYLI